jgi:hypothetical protein
MLTPPRIVAEYAEMIAHCHLPLHADEFLRRDFVIDCVISTRNARNKKSFVDAIVAQYEKAKAINPSIS